MSFPALLRRSIAGIALLLAAAPALAKPPLVAAAADLQFALEEVHRQFQADTGQSLRLVFGSSGNFHRQISEGAPFQLYLSADEEYVYKLQAAGLTRDAGALYAVGRIVLMLPRGSSLAADGQLGDLRAALGDGRLRRFAIANPEHAPYGRRAEEALRHAGLWGAIEPRLVLGENIAQAAQFVTSANAQGGIIAYSLALSPALGERTEHALIPADWHRPLRQRMVLLKGAGETAEAFYHYLQQPAARATLGRYGFALPEAP